MRRGTNSVIAAFMVGVVLVTAVFAACCAIDDSHSAAQGMGATLCAVTGHTSGAVLATPAVMSLLFTAILAFGIVVTGGTQGSAMHLRQLSLAGLPPPRDPRHGRVRL